MEDPKNTLFHGILDIWIYEATKIENKDRFMRSARDMFGKRLPDSVLEKNEGLLYVTVSLAGVIVARTSTVGYTERNPVWNERLIVPVAHYSSHLGLAVKNSAGLEFHGTGGVGLFYEADNIIQGRKVEGTFRIVNSVTRRVSRTPAKLRVSIQYIPVERLNIYCRGVGSDPDYSGVLGTYFPLRQGGNITLYQDAHVSDGCLPPVKLDHGVDYQHGKCWYDIFNAIRQARHLIYITGWSLYHKVRLVRDIANASESDSTLGDLLNSKSKEGVKVLLLLWDDPTSVTTWAYRTDGLMRTHDEETRRFFKHSSVKVLLTPRSAGKRGDKQKEAGTIYTHHQKSVIVDTDGGNNKRKIVAFIGGLDLCDGRYDSPQHPLFGTLQTLHKDDYYNPSFKGATDGCPREAWHDSHCKIDGPAACDVLTNFEDRWYKASKGVGDDFLRIDLTPDIIWSLDTSGLDGNDPLNDNDPEAWHAQVFRSIDSNSVECFSEDSKQVANQSLVFGIDNVVVDLSIHSAYVHAVRAAQHFIYIENQYFLGSSYNWTGYKDDAGENNLVPMEIALKIANKIRANERFAAYVLVPMWPEGVPTSTVTQKMLFWQFRTMEMMYVIIYKALEEVGLEKAFVPQDYLNFFCLGNREAPDGNASSSGGRSTAPTTPQELAKKSRRSMIYVHSNVMIVDDEYIILGSANINQRSMEGTKDTEIAMGAYQPEYTWARKLSSPPHGQIYGYRMSLWAEHMGMVDDCFMQPQSVECARRVRSSGESNWKQFAADDATEMRGHLLKYPVEVDQTGKVKSLPGTEFFPDMGGNIIGTWDGTL